MFSIDSGKMNFTFEPPVFPSCKTIDIEQYLYYDFRKISPRQITFDFFKINNIGLYLYIEDKTKALKRPLKSSKLSYLGPSISNSNLDAPTKQNLIIRTEFNLKYTIRSIVCEATFIMSSRSRSSRSSGSSFLFSTFRQMERREAFGLTGQLCRQIN